MNRQFCRDKNKQAFSIKPGEAESEWDPGNCNEGHCAGASGRKGSWKCVLREKLPLDERCG